MPDLKVCLEAYQSLTAHTDALCSEANNHLRISCHASIGTLGEDELITDFGAIHPEIRIEELVDIYGRPAGKAALEGIDLAFSLLREEDLLAMQKQRELTVLPLRKIRPQILLSRYHKAALHDSVDLGDLSDETFLFRSPPGTSIASIDDMLLQLFISACASEGFSPNISFCQLRSNTVFNMVSAEMGILLLMYPPYTLPENTVLLPLSKEYYSVIFAAYCYKDNRSPALRNLLDFLKNRADPIL